MSVGGILTWFLGDHSKQHGDEGHLSSYISFAYTCNCPLRTMFVVEKTSGDRLALFVTTEGPEEERMMLTQFSGVLKEREDAHASTVAVTHLVH